MPSPSERPRLCILPDREPAPGSLDDLRLLPIPLVADVLGLSQRTIYNLIAAGSLSPVVVRGKYRIPWSELAAFVARLKAERPYPSQHTPGRPPPDAPRRLAAGRGDPDT